MGEGYINHPDHRNAGLVAIDAIFPAADNPMFYPEMTDEGYLPHKISHLYVHGHDQPNVKIDITDDIETKIDAILCHKIADSATGRAPRNAARERWGEKAGRRQRALLSSLQGDEVHVKARTRLSCANAQICLALTQNLRARRAWLAALHAAVLMSAAADACSGFAAQGAPQVLRVGDDGRGVGLGAPLHEADAGFDLGLHAALAQSAPRPCTSAPRQPSSCQGPSGWACRS